MAYEVIDGLKPETLWKRFYEISQVPRCSKQEGKILQYVKNFAAEHNVELKEDEVGNLVLKVPATEGYENAPVVILQGHVDMVCEKNKGTEHDFENDPIKLTKEDGWITAVGTTLGADNGIGVAANLSTVTDKSFIHGPLEILCTIDEETGLTGANNLGQGMLEGKIMLNTDSEEDGAFYVGCSGGQDTLGYFNIDWEDAPAGYQAYELMVTGLKGGHSGMEIHMGRGNAIKLLARLMNKLDISYAIAEINGGSKRNAIPREAEVVILINNSDEEKVKAIAAEFVSEALLEYKKNDGGVRVEFKAKENTPNKVFTKNFSDKIFDILRALPHGVLAMSPDIPGLVETSTNLATIFTEGDKLRIGTSQRSSIDSAKDNIASMVKSCFTLAGAIEINDADSYPGWQPNMGSELLKIGKEVYKEKFGGEPEIKAIHAGLECGILADKYPGLDMISFGPTIEGAHSPDERVKIEDVEKFYELLKGILEHIAQK